MDSCEDPAVDSYRYNLWSSLQSENWVAHPADSTWDHLFDKPEGTAGLDTEAEQTKEKHPSVLFKAVSEDGKEADIDARQLTSCEIGPAAMPTQSNANELEVVSVSAASTVGVASTEAEQVEESSPHKLVDCGLGVQTPASTQAPEDGDDLESLFGPSPVPQHAELAPRDESEETPARMPSPDMKEKSLLGVQLERPKLLPRNDPIAGISSSNLPTNTLVSSHQVSGAVPVQVYPLRSPPVSNFDPPAYSPLADGSAYVQTNVVTQSLSRSAAGPSHVPVAHYGSPSPIIGGQVRPLSTPGAGCLPSVANQPGTAHQFAAAPTTSKEFFDVSKMPTAAPVLNVNQVPSPPLSDVEASHYSPRADGSADVVIHHQTTSAAEPPQLRVPNYGSPSQVTVPHWPSSGTANVQALAAAPIHQAVHSLVRPLSTSGAGWLPNAGSQHPMPISTGQFASGPAISTGRGLSGVSNASTVAGPSSAYRPTHSPLSMLGVGEPRHTNDYSVPGLSQRAYFLSPAPSESASPLRYQSSHPASRPDRVAANPYPTPPPQPITQSVSQQFHGVAYPTHGPIGGQPSPQGFRPPVFLVAGGSSLAYAEGQPNFPTAPLRSSQDGTTPSLVQAHPPTSISEPSPFAQGAGEVYHHHLSQQHHRATAPHSALHIIHAQQRSRPIPLRQPLPPAYGYPPAQPFHAPGAVHGRPDNGYARQISPLQVVSPPASGPSYHGPRAGSLPTPPPQQPVTGPSSLSALSVNRPANYAPPPPSASRAPSSASISHPMPAARQVPTEAATSSGLSSVIHPTGNNQSQYHHIIQQRHSVHHSAPHIIHAQQHSQSTALSQRLLGSEAPAYGYPPAQQFHAPGAVHGRSNNGYARQISSQQAVSPPASGLSYHDPHAGGLPTPPPQLPVTGPNSLSALSVNRPAHHAPPRPSASRAGPPSSASVSHPIPAARQVPAATPSGLSSDTPPTGNPEVVIPTACNKGKSKVVEELPPIPGSSKNKRQRDDDEEQEPSTSTAKPKKSKKSAEEGTGPEDTRPRRRCPKPKQGVTQFISTTPERARIYYEEKEKEKEKGGKNGKGKAKRKTK